MDTACVTVRATPHHLILGAAFAAFLGSYPQMDFIPDRERIVGLRRRIGALFIDLHVAGVCIMIPGVALTLALEATLTGTFDWSVSRAFGRLSDGIIAIVTLLGLIAFFYWHVANNRQTPGQYIFGYRVEPLDLTKPPKYAMSVVYGFVGLLLSWLSALQIVTDEKKLAWWNKVSNTRLVPSQ